VDDPTAYGLIETDAEGRVTRWLEKPAWNEVLQRKTNMINAGTYVLELNVLALIPPQKEVSIEKETFQRLLAQGEPMYAYSSQAYWMDMGTPEKYLQLHRDLLSGKCRHYGLTPGEEVLTGEHTDIHPTAQIKGPVILGNNCSIGRRVHLIGPVVIGDGCTILEDSVIEDSVIGRNARFGPRANLKGAILADNCCLNEGSICVESVLGDDVIVLNGCKLEPGSKIEPGKTVDRKTD
jgi:mannose-1-phosphate guanylyltransferase